MTDQINFEEQQDFPPAFLNEPTAPRIGTTIRINRANQTAPASMRIRIRDENVDDELTLRMRIRLKNEDNPPFTERLVPNSGTPVRDFEVPLQIDQLRFGKCHMLELVVSGSFIPTDPPNFFYREKKDPDDIAFASWYVWEGEVMTKDEQAAIADSCPEVNQLSTAGALQASPP